MSEHHIPKGVSLDTLKEVVAGWATAGADEEPQYTSDVEEHTSVSDVVGRQTRFLEELGVLEPHRQKHRLTDAGATLARALAAGDDERAREQARELLADWPLTEDLRGVLTENSTDEETLLPILADLAEQDIDATRVEPGLSTLLDAYEWTGTLERDDEGRYRLPKDTGNEAGKNEVPEGDSAERSEGVAKASGVVEDAEAALEAAEEAAAVVDGDAERDAASGTEPQLTSGAASLGEEAERAVAEAARDTAREVAEAVAEERAATVAADVASEIDDAAEKAETAAETARDVAENVETTAENVAAETAASEAERAARPVAREAAADAAEEIARVAAEEAAESVARETAARVAEEVATEQAESVAETAASEAAQQSIEETAGEVEQIAETVADAAETIHEVAADIDARQPEDTQETEDTDGAETAAESAGRAETEPTDGVESAEGPTDGGSSDLEAAAEALASDHLDDVAGVDVSIGDGGDIQITLEEDADVAVSVDDQTDLADVDLPEGIEIRTDASSDGDLESDGGEPVPDGGSIELGEDGEAVRIDVEDGPGITISIGDEASAESADNAAGDEAVEADGESEASEEPVEETEAAATETTEEAAESGTEADEATAEASEPEAESVNQTIEDIAETAAEAKAAAEEAKAAAEAARAATGNNGGAGGPSAASQPHALSLAVDVDADADDLEALIRGIKQGITDVRAGETEE